MKNLLLSLLLLFIFISAQSFAQSEVKPIVQKKSKVFFRAEMLGANLSLYPNASNYGSTNGNIYSGVNTSYTIGYAITPKVRLGAGAEALTEGYVGANGGGPAMHAVLPVYASFEYGDHTKRVSPFYDFNAGYAFMNKDDLDANIFSSGMFFEMLPGVSFGSKKSSSRLRIGVGSQLEFTRVSYPPIHYILDTESPSARYDPTTNTYNYGSFIMRMVLKAGIDF